MPCPAWMHAKRTATRKTSRPSSARRLSREARRFIGSPSSLIHQFFDARLIQKRIGEFNLVQGFGDLPDNLPRLVPLRFGFPVVPKSLLDIGKTGIGEPKLKVCAHSTGKGTGFS